VISDRFALKLARCPRSLAATLAAFTLITRTARARASYLAALPSTRAMPDRDVFYVADPIRSIVSRSLRFGSTATRRGFTGHVPAPSRSIRRGYGGTGQ
jgi:hypothetical protein